MKTRLIHKTLAITLIGSMISPLSSSLSSKTVFANAGGIDGIIGELDKNGKRYPSKTFGGSLEDKILAIDKTLDGGYILSGNSFSTNGDIGKNSGDRDAFIVKLDSKMNVIWRKVVGGTRPDSFTNVRSTQDGGYIATGYTNSKDGDFPGGNSWDAIVVKFDKDGNIQWNKRFGGYRDDSPNQIVETTEGNYVVAGYSDATDGTFLNKNKGTYDAFLVMIDKNGNLIWSQTLGGTKVDSFYGLTITSDGNIVAVGNTQSTDKDFQGLAQGSIINGIIAKYDKNGNLLWVHDNGGIADDTYYAVKQTLDGGFVTAGWEKTTTNYDAILSKFDANGIHQWTKSFGGTNTDMFKNLDITSQDEYVLSGYTLSPEVMGSFNKGGTDTFTVKTNNKGEPLWHKLMGGTGNDNISDVLVGEDDKIIIVGDSNSTNGDFEPDNSPPDEVSMLKSEKDSNKVTLTWTNPANDDFDFVNVYRDNQFIKTIPSTESSYIDVNVAENTQYKYKLVTVDTSGNSSTGTELLAKTLDKTPPMSIAQLNETHTDKEVTLKWINPEDEDFKTVHVYRNGILLFSSETATSFTDTNLKDGESYSYKITTKDDSLNESEGVQIQVKTTDVTPPGSITQLKETHTDKQVTLTWENPEDEDFNFVDIYRDGRLIYTGSSTSFTDKQLLERTIYDYKIVAVDNDNNRSEGTSIKITTNDELQPTKAIDIMKNVSKEITHNVKNESVTEDNKKLTKYTISPQAINTVLENNTQVDNVALKLPSAEEKQVVVIPTNVIDSLKDVNTNIKLVTEDNKELSIKVKTVPDVPTLKNLQVEIQNPERDALKVEQNKGIITGENIGKVSIQMIDDSNKVIENKKNDITVSIKFPESLRGKELETNIYKKDVTNNSYAMIHSKTEGKVKTFKVTDGEANYSIGTYDKTFKDVTEGNWATQTINFMVSKNFVSGMTEDTFQPEKQVTRAEFISMLVKATGYPKASVTSSKFSDVPTNSWYYNDLLIAEENNLIKGISANSFGPDKTLTREESVTILLRVMEKEGLKFPVTESEVATIPTKFKDSNSISNWARSDMAKAIKYKLTNGLSENSISATTNANRAQAATFVKKTLDRLEWY